MPKMSLNKSINNQWINLDDKRPRRTQRVDFIFFPEEGVEIWRLCSATLEEANEYDRGSPIYWMKSQPIPSEIKKFIKRIRPKTG